MGLVNEMKVIKLLTELLEDKDNEIKDLKNALEEIRESIRDDEEGMFIPPKEILHPDLINEWYKRNPEDRLKPDDDEELPQEAKELMNEINDDLLKDMNQGE